MTRFSLNCVECGASFDVPPCRALSAKYCSDRCQKIGSGRARRGIAPSISEAGRARTIEAVRAAHRAGRCAPSVSEQANRKRAASIKRAHAEGRVHIDPETKRRLADEASQRMTGKPIPPGKRSSAGPSHFNAKFWLLRTPDRNLLIGPNLNEIIRRHIHLFAPEDVSGPTNKTRARKGLSGLFEVRRPRDRAPYVMEQWKGWTAVNKAEMVKDVGVPFERLKFKPAAIGAPKE